MFVGGVFVWGFGVLFLSCVCVGAGGVVLCRCVRVCDLLIFPPPTGRAGTDELTILVEYRAEHFDLFS